MLVWVNGPFGVGKTQVAHELARRLPNGFVSDPEQLGFALRRMLPPPIRGNFQRLPLWRSTCRDLLSDILDRYDGVVVAPMTLLCPAYRADIVDAIAERGHQVAHFTLLASVDTIRRRHRSRGQSWRHFATNQVQADLDTLSAPEFAHHIPTDNRRIPDIAAEIARQANLALTPTTDGPLTRRARQLAVTLRHIRFD